MKNFFIVWMLCSIAMLSLAGCGSSGTKSPPSSQADKQTADAGKAVVRETNVSMGEAAASKAKALIVYYSWSGNTKQVADEIQKLTGADVFEIVPEKPYTKDYDTLVQLAKEEKQNNVRPAISGKIDGFENYDVVFVGFPNWWSDLPMVLYTLFEAYDFSGKKIVPFCTSGGGGFAGSMKAIQSLEPNADLLDGLHINGSQSGNAQDEVKGWLKQLSLANEK